MHPANLIANSLAEEDREPLPCEPVEEICCVTGQKTLCLPRRKVILDTNCDQPWFKASTSDWCGVDIWTAWKYRPERASSWWTDGVDMRLLRRPDVRDLVLSGSPAAPWAMWVTTSYKKHGSIRAAINQEKHGLIAFDELLVDCSDYERVMSWWEIMTQAQQDGIWRTIIETVECPPGLIGKIGLDKWMAFERWATPKKNSPLYRLLCYLLWSKEEMKENNANSNSG